MESRGYQTDVIVNHEYNELEDLLESRITQIGKSERYKGHRKVKEDEFGHNVDAPQESIQNYEADECEENGKGRFIKIEKFECSDDNILPSIAVELESLSVSKYGRVEESKRNEGHSKVKVDKFDHNVEEPQESVQNYETNQYEGNEKNMIIKVEKFECSNDILPQSAVEHYEPEQSIENQTNMSVKLEQRYGKVQNLFENRINESGHNNQVPQKSDHKFETDEYEENGKGRFIKVEKFEFSDNILPSVVVEHYKQQQSIENPTRVSVKLEHHCDKLEKISVSKNYQVEESKRSESHCKVKVDEFSHNVEEPQESVQNYESNQYELNEKTMVIKVEKFEWSYDIIPQIALEHCDPEQSIENQTTPQVSLNQPEKYKRNQVNEDCTTIVASAVYEASDDNNSSTKPYSKQRRRNVSENQNHKVLNIIDAFDNISDNYEDTVRNELSENDDSISVNAEISKVLGSDAQCYVALEKLFYKCDLCRYVTVIKELLVTHMKLHDYKQSDSISECELQLKNQIISEKYEHKQTLQRHQLSHTGEKPFACNLCSYRSARKSDFNIHKLIHTGEKRFACNLCSYKSVHKSYLTQHKLTHSGEKPFACNICSYKSARKSNLQKHQLTHYGEMPFACNLCSYKSVDKSNLMRHKLKHTGEKPFACNLCLYKSARKSDFNIHKLIHTGEKPFACNLCSYRSARKSDFNIHKLIHTGEKRFACNLCSYKSVHKSYLTRHKLTHTGEKPFACNICSYKSARKSNLQKHQLTHYGEMPLACNLCSYKSVDKSNLMRHKLKHNGEKPFACNICSYKSAKKSNLQKHQLTHTVEKRFACNLCSYKSYRKSNLMRHKLKHTGEKLFACNLCSYKSVHKSNLKRHQLKHCSQQRARDAGAGLSVKYS